MRKWSIGRSPDVFFLRIVKNRLGTRLYVYMLCAKWGKERCDSTQGDTSTAVRLSDVEYYIIVHDSGGILLEEPVCVKLSPCVGYIKGKFYAI